MDDDDYHISIYQRQANGIWHHIGYCRKSNIGETTDTIMKENDLPIFFMETGPVDLSQEVLEGIYQNYLPKIIEEYNSKTYLWGKN